MNKKNVNVKRNLRIYCLVPYNLSPIQQGVQAAHAIAEYSLKHDCQKSYKVWAQECKTLIILNAGTTGPNSTMIMHKKALDKLNVKYAVFVEPDLNNALTAIAFIVDMEEDSHVVGYLKQMRLA